MLYVRRVLSFLSLLKTLSDHFFTRQCWQKDFLFSPKLMMKVDSNSLMNWILILNIKLMHVLIYLCYFGNMCALTRFSPSFVFLGLFVFTRFLFILIVNSEVYQILLWFQMGLGDIERANIRYGDSQPPSTARYFISTIKVNLLFG